VADAAALSSDLRTSQAETELGAECASDQDAKLHLETYPQRGGESFMIGWLKG
jgi:hypothetical protein